MIATVFDTETTGLIENPARKLDSQPEIISIAIQNINLETGEIFDLYYREFKPQKPLTKNITEITKITNEQLADAPSIETNLPRIVEKLSGASLIIGQNIRFDMDMIELECKRYNLSIKWPKIMDLVQNTIHLKGYRLSLTNLHLELFGTEFDSAHIASVDCAITSKCAIELFKRGLL
jgi:DNA polymerase-3 subunit alpha (Gram-positive type)